MKRETILLVIIFLLGLAIRLVPLINSNFLIGADGFFHYRATNYILSTGFIQQFDNFSFGGRDHIYAPGFHLFAAAVASAINYPLHRLVLFFSYFFYFFSFLAAVVYSRRLAINPILTTLFFVTLPVYVWRTTSNFLAEALWAYLIFVLLICFKNRLHLLLVTAGLAATHSIALIIIPIFLVIYRRDRPAVIALWLLLIFTASFWFKVDSPYQNVPLELRQAIFEHLDPIKYVQRSGLQGLLAIPSLPAAGLLILMWLATNFGFVAIGLLELDRAIGSSALIISGLAAKFTAKLMKPLQILIAIISLIWAFHQLSALDWAYIPQDTLTGLHWLRQNTPVSAVIASPVGEGYWVAAIAQRKNIVDGHFAGIKDIDTRLNDIKSVYTGDTTPLATYQSRYILATLNANYLYGFSNYSSNGLNPIFNRERATIYSPR